MSGPTRRHLLAGAGAVAIVTGLSACGREVVAPRTAGPGRPIGPVAPPDPGGSVRAALSDPTPAAADRAHAAFVPTGSRTSGRVALMFHGDGDRATTDGAVRALGRLQVTASVFAIGRWLVEQPTIARVLLDAGHELGNHSMTHPDFRRLPAARMRVEVERCRDVLVRQVRTPGVGLLAPEVDLPVPALLAVAAKAGYDRVIGWDVDPRDWADPGPDVVARIVGGGSRPGSIVQLHLGHPQTVAALPRIVGRLRERGLEPTSVTGLLGG